MYQANYIHIRVTFNGAILLCSFRQIPTCFNLLGHFWKQLIRGILKNNSINLREFSRKYMQNSCLHSKNLELY